MFNMLALDIIARTAFSMEYGFIQSNNNEYIQNIREITLLLHQYANVPFWRWFHPFQYNRLLKLTKSVQDVARKAIQQRKTTTDTKNDMINLLVRNKDENGGTLTDQEIVDNI